MRTLKPLIAIFMLLLVFASCGGNGGTVTTPPTETAPQTTPGGTTAPPVTTAPPEEVDLLAKNYVMVYNKSDSSDNRLMSAILMVLTRVGITIPGVAHTAAPTEYEIILTNATERPESVELYQRLMPNASDYIGAYALVFEGDKILLSASCREAEVLAAEALASYVKNGTILIPKGTREIVYFDRAEYNRSGNVISWSESEIATLCALGSLSFAGYDPIELKAGQYLYEVPYDVTVQAPSPSTATATALHPSMTCQVAVTAKTAVISVTSIDGSVNNSYIVNFVQSEKLSISAEIVNKDGAKGVLTLISDDGDQRTSDFLFTEIAPRYSAFKITIAMPTHKIASLTKTEDGSAWLLDENGKYVLTILPNEYNSTVAGSVFQTGKYPTMVDFWKKIVSCDSIVIVSHSHSHESWGVTDEQNGSYPAGNVIKELHASAQILQDLLGQQTSLIVRPGGSNDFTSDYFYDLVASDPTFLGMRTTNGAPPLPGSSATKLNSVEQFATLKNRLNIATVLVRGYEAAFSADGKGFANKSGDSGKECLASGISAWTHYVDLAIEHGQWASMGFHYIAPDQRASVDGYATLYSQFKALMDYVQPLVDCGDLWLPTFEEAAKYYFEWSTASLSATCYGEDRIEILLDDEETDPRFDEKLTVKVTVPHSWNSVRLESYGTAETLTVHTAEDGTHFVYANILPGTGVSTLRSAD